MILNVELSQDAAKVIDGLRDFPERLAPAIARGLDKGLELALGRTTAKRFTGKGPFPVSEHRLGVVTGRLRASLRRSAAVVSGGNVVASVGTNVRYFGPHEYGFNGTVNVRAHQRVSLRTEKGKVISQRAARKAKGTITGIAHEVRAHTRRVNIPERAPLRTGMADEVGILGRTISDALLDEWRKGVRT